MNAQCVRRRSVFPRVAPALFLVLLLTGCHDVPPPTYCYMAVSGTVRAVDTGMNVAGDLYRSGKLTEDQKVRLVAAHDIYRPIAKAAVDGCRVVEAQGDADKQIEAIRKAADHVIEALVQAGVLK